MVLAEAEAVVAWYYSIMLNQGVIPLLLLAVGAVEVDITEVPILAMLVQLVEAVRR